MCEPMTSLLAILYRNSVAAVAIVRSWSKQNALVWDEPHLPKLLTKYKWTQIFEAGKLSWNFFINS